MVALPHPQPVHDDVPSTIDQKASGGFVSTMQSMEEVGQLVIKMSQACQHGDIFKIFAEQVTLIVPGLTHISVLLLPAAQQSSASKPGLPPQTTSKGSPHKSKPTAKSSLTTRLDWQQYMGGAKTSKADAVKRVEPDLLTWPYADLQTGNEMPVLDWRSCKDVAITAKNGVEVKQPPPAYPVSCMAACYVARTHADSVTTPDYMQDGPHFADWGEMQAQGAVSMASAPIHMSNEVVAVLTLASSQQAAFEESKAKLTWVLSFVLAPYAHILSQATHKTDAHWFVASVMPRLLEQSRAHQVAAVQDTPSGPETEPTIDPDSHKCAHTESLCSECQLASRPQARPSKQGGGHKGPAPGSFSTELQANGTAASVGHTYSSRGPTAGQTFQAEPHLAPPHSALDWGDFFFNLVSMCIVYAHFSEAAVAGEGEGEGNTAVIFSMAIAAVDIVLLAVRWLWYQHFMTHRSRTSSVLTLYRLVVLPVANTWMSWSLLHKLHWDPNPPFLAALTLLMTLFLALGLKVRFFLHAPLQLVTVLLAAASAQHVCSAVQATTGGAACLSLISAQQLFLGLLIPSVLMFVLDYRVGSGYMPHIQAKHWAHMPS
ncbi:hypothetical protein ABBQ38_001880 [Trebouxia sp. C0009 RCD-2024]